METKVRFQSVPRDGDYPDSKFHGVNMGPVWGRQDPGVPHVGPMDFAIWVAYWGNFLRSLIF